MWAFQHTATRRWLPIGMQLITPANRGFNTQPPEGGCMREPRIKTRYVSFQHTATRRWLPIILRYDVVSFSVSTHSHPKVAALYTNLSIYILTMFQHTATRRWLRSAATLGIRGVGCFNTQPPEGGCSPHKKARKISRLNTVFR